MKRKIRLLRTTFRLVKSDVLRYHNVFGYTWLNAIVVVFKLYILKDKYQKGKGNG